MDHALLLLDLLWEHYDKDANPLWQLMADAIRTLDQSRATGNALCSARKRVDRQCVHAAQEAESRKGSEGHKSWKAGAYGNKARVHGSRAARDQVRVHQMMDANGVKRIATLSA